MFKYFLVNSFCSIFFSHLDHRREVNDVAMAAGEEADDRLAVPVRSLNSQSHVTREGGPPPVSTLKTLPHNLEILTNK